MSALVEGMEGRLLLTDTVTVSVLDGNASEMSGDTGTYRVTRTGSVGALTVYYQISTASTATSGTDYSPLSSSVTFSAGETSKDILVTPVNDAVSESSETVVLALTTTADEEYLVGTPMSATIRIADDDSGTGMITFNVASSTSLITEDNADADNNSVNYTVGYTGTLTGNNTASVDVSHVLNQTAGSDYATNVTAAIAAAVASTPGTTFNGTTLTFGPVGGTTASVSGNAGNAVAASGTGHGTWSTPEAAIGTSSSDFAAVWLDYRDYSDELRLTNFGFNIPADATVNGIIVNLDTSGSDWNKDSPGVKITKNGQVSVGTPPASSSNWGNGSVVVGSTTSLWGTTWTPAEINASNFGAIIKVRSDDDGYEFRVRTAQILVSYSTPGSPAPASLNFTAQISDDGVAESSESFSVALSNAVTTNSPGATITSGVVSTTILDNDIPATPVVTVAAVDGTAGETGPSTGAFRLTRTDVSGSLTVSYALDPASTAVSGTDYASLSGSVTFAAGEAFRDVVVTPVDDALFEQSETISLNLSAAAAGEYQLGAQVAATVTIEDNDMVVWVAGAQAAVEGGQQGSFTLERSFSSGTLTVNYLVQTSSTALSGGDYLPLSGTVTFADGSTTAVIDVTAVDDAVIEASESLNIQLFHDDQSVDQYVVGTSAAGSATIVDNDLLLVSISAGNTNPSETGPISGLFTVSRTGSTTNALTVNYTITGTASNGTDYQQLLETAGVGSVTIPAGQNSTTIQVTPLADTLTESSETVVLTLIAPQGYSVEAQASEASLTIADNPPVAPPITFSISGSPAVTEDPTDADDNHATYTIGYTGTLTGSETASVNVTHLLNQTAGSDYSNAVATAIIAAAANTPGTSFNGTTLTFGALPGATVSSAKYAGTAVNSGTSDNGTTWSNATLATGNTPGDYSFIGVDKRDYSSELRLTNFGFSIPSNATITGITAILDTSGSDASMSGTGIKVTRDGTTPTGTPPTSTTNWSTGSVVSGSSTSLWGTTWTAAEVNSPDFGLIIMVRSDDDGNQFRVASANIVVSYSLPGGTAPTSLTFDVQVADDSMVEPAESFSLSLSSPATTSTAGASIATGTVVTTINDNDVAATPVVTVVAIDDIASETGNSPGTFRVTRTDANSPLTVTYQVDSASTATSGTDYGTLSGSVTFAVGETFRDITVTPVNDQSVEMPETVKLSLMAAGSGEYLLGPVAETTATITIDDNDNGVWVASTQDGAEGGASGSITLQRNNTVGTLYVTYLVESGASAQSGSDYTWLSGSVTFASGSGTVVIPVSIVDDAVVETDESFTVRVYWDYEESGDYIVGTPASGTVTISDNDVAPVPVVTVTSIIPVAFEKAAAPGAIRISRTDTASPLTVAYQVNSTSTATSGVDYSALSGTVTFAAGESWRDIVVTPIDDSESEDIETISVTLLSATAGQYVIGEQAAAEVTLADDDIVVWVSGTQNALEGTQNGAITLQRTSTFGDFSVVMYLESASAIHGKDFSWLPFSIMFPAGQSTVTVPVVVTDDLEVENLESLTVRLSADFVDGGYTVGMVPTGTVTITDNDVPPTPVVSTVSIAALDAAASESGFDAGIIRITRTSSDGPLTVWYKVSELSTATTDTDFFSPGTTVTFDDGELSVDISVIPINDFDIEFAETVTIDLLPPAATDPAATPYLLDTVTTATVSLSDNDGSTVPIVTITAPDAVADENDGETATFRVRRSNALGALTVDFVVAASTTATTALDYAAIGTSVTFADGEFYTDIVITPTDDSELESAETLTINLIPSVSGSMNYDLETESTATVSILDTDVLVWVASVQDGVEGGVQPAITFQRSNSSGNLVVPYSVISSTALADYDFLWLDGYVEFSDGASTATITISTVNDAEFEAAESLTLQLGASTDNSWMVGTPASATVTITDDDVAAPPTVIITAERPQAFEADESEGVFRIRRSYATGSLTVLYEVAGSSTALSGIDFASLTGSVTFADGEYFRDINVQPIDDTLLETSELITVTLLPPAAAGDYVPGGRSSASITVLDNDLPVVNVVAVDSLASEIPQENAGENESDFGVFRFTRSNTTGPLTVTYHLDSSSSATSGIDFQALSGTLTFADGEAVIDLTVQTMLDGLDELPETIVIELLPPVSESVVWLPGEAAAATVTINDAPVITALTLVNNTGLATDEITSDGTVKGQLRDDGFLSSYYSNTSDYVVEIDLGNDGTIDLVISPDWEQDVNAQWGQSFEFSALTADQVAGFVSLKARVIETLETGEELTGWWQTLSFDYEPEPVNQAPSFSGPDLTVTVGHAVPVGTILATITAVDPDAGDLLTYSLQGSMSLPLTIDSATGAVTYTGGGFGNRVSLDFTVVAQDQDGLSATIDVHLGIIRNNTAPIFSAASYALSVAADAQSGRVVGFLLASDPDQQDALTFTLGNPGQAPFAINSSTGEVTYTGSALVASTTYTVSAVVTDSFGSADSTTVTIEILAAGSTAGTGTEVLSRPGGVAGVGYEPDPTTHFIPTSLVSGTTTSTVTGSFARSLATNSGTQLGTGQQNLTTTTVTTGSLGSSWTFSEVVLWSYDLVQDSGNGNSIHLWGSYTSTFTASYSLDLDTYATNFVLFTDDSYSVTSTVAFENGTMTGTSTGNSHGTTTIHSFDGGGVLAPFGTITYLGSSTNSDVGSGTYSYGVAGGSVSGTISSDGMSLDASMYTATWYKDSAGAWYMATGFSTMNGMGQSHSTTSGSGNYVTPIEGGSISGSISEASAENSNYNYSATGTFLAGAADWTYFGMATSMGDSAQNSSADGSGSYVISTTDSSRSGSVTQSSSQKSNSQYNVSSMMTTDGKWEISNGSGTGQGDDKASSSYTGTGTYTRSLAGGSKTGTITGTTNENGSSTSKSDYQTTSSMGSDGQWITSGTGNGSGSGNSYSDNSGSGQYSREFAGGTINGQFSEDAHSSSQNEYTTSSVLSPGTGWTSTGSGSGSSDGHSHAFYSGKGQFLQVTQKLSDPSSYYESSVSGDQSELGSSDSESKDKWTSVLNNGSWKTTTGEGTITAATNFTYKYESTSGTYHNWGTRHDGYTFDSSGSMSASGDEYRWSDSKTGSAVIDGKWKQVSGSGSGGDGKHDMTSSSGSGVYSRKNSQFRAGTGSKGESISGTTNQSGNSENHRDDLTTSTWAAEKWTTVGSSSASGSNKSHSDFDGSADYSWVDLPGGGETTSFNGHIHEEGKVDNSGSSDSVAELADNKWTLISGSGSSSGSSHSKTDFNGTGTYKRYGIDEEQREWQTSGTMSADGGAHNDSSDESKSQVIGGKWAMISGSGSASGGNHSNDTRNGSGFFLSGGVNGTIVENSGAQESWEWNTDSTWNPATEASGSSSGTPAHWTTSGSGSGVDNSNSSFTVKTNAYFYSKPIPGGVMNSYAKALTTHDVLDNTDYKASWNDKAGTWDLTSGSSEFTDKKAVGETYSGAGSTKFSGDFTSPDGTKTGNWSFTGMVSEDGTAKAGTGTFSKSSVVDGKWQLLDEGALTYADKIVNASSSGSGTFTDGALSGSYTQGSNGSGGFEWTIYVGKTGSTGDAKWFTSGSSNANTDGSGTITARDTTGTLTFNNSSKASDDGKINYTYDPGSEKFFAKSGDKITSQQETKATSNYTGSGTPESGSGSVTYSFDRLHSENSTTSRTVSTQTPSSQAVSTQVWKQQVSGGGSYTKNSAYVSSSSGSYGAAHGLTGTWTQINKDGGTSQVQWSSSGTGESLSHSGSGLISGYTSAVSAKSASGDYTDGVANGKYSESFSNNGSTEKEIFLTRSANGSWIGNGAVSGSGSGVTDVSDRWSSVVTDSYSGGSTTTKTEGDKGRHYDYKLGTEQRLKRNTWSVTSGSGSGQGSGWAYLTTDKNGTSTTTISSPTDPFDFFRYENAYVVHESLTVTTESDSSDKLDYKYKHEFTLTPTGWATSETGSGTWNKSDHYESRSKGSANVSASAVLGFFELTDWNIIGTHVQIQTSTSVDHETIRDSKDTAVFSWSDGNWTTTERSTTSEKRHDYIDMKYDVQSWISIGNIGAGNGGTESANLSWSYSSKRDRTGSTESNRTITTGNGQSEWSADWKSSQKDVHVSSEDDSRHSEAHSRTTFLSNGVTTHAMSDYNDDREYHSKSRSNEETKQQWSSSNDGSTHSSTFEQTDLVEGTFNKTSSHEIKHTTKTWDDSGVTGEYVWQPSSYELIDVSSFATESISDNNIIPQPTFTAGSLAGMGVSTAVTLTGGVTSGLSGSYSFSLPSLKSEADDGISAADLPPMEMTTTDFEQLGQVADTRTWRQKLSDLIIVGAETAHDAALETAVWVSDQAQDYGYIVSEFFVGAWKGAKNLAFGGYMMVHDLVTIPIDFIMTTYGIFDTSNQWEPLSYFGAGTEQALQNGTHLVEIENDILKGIVSLGLSGFIESGHEWYITGDATSFQQHAGGFATGLLVFGAAARASKPKVSAPNAKALGNCFVGETQIVIGIDEAFPIFAIATSATATEENLLWARLCMLVGTLAGVVVLVDERKKRRPLRLDKSKGIRIDDDATDQSCQDAKALIHLSESPSEMSRAFQESQPADADDSMSIHHVTARSEVLADRVVSEGITPGQISAIVKCIAVISLLLGLWLGFGSKLEDSGATTLAVAELVAAPTSNSTPRYETVAIRDIQPAGYRVLADNPQTRGQAAGDFGEFDPKTWKVHRFLMTKPNGGWLKIGLSRPMAWIDFVKRNDSGQVWLEFEELGIADWATLQKTEPCPTDILGEGRLVTGTFEHSSGEVLNLFIAGEATPIGSTANHPFWSEDRQDFVQAGSLKPGEHLRLADGRTTTLERTEAIAEQLPVYNLEVDGEHVYFVGESGVLVHNAYDTANPRSLLSRQGPREMTKSRVRSMAAEILEDPDTLRQMGPVRVAEGPGGVRIIIDGHHRTAAAIEAGLAEIRIFVERVSAERWQQLMSEVLEAAGE